MHPRPLAFLGFPASQAAEMRGTPQKHQNRRVCNTRSFSGGHFQGPLYFLDFRLPGPPKWGEPNKCTKIVGFAIPAPFPEAISKGLCISWISCFQGRRNGGCPTKAPKLSILQYPLLVRKPFPRPLVFLGFPASKPPKWGEPNKSTKMVDFAIPAAFPEAISKGAWISWISGICEISSARGTSSVCSLGPEWGGGTPRSGPRPN